MIMFDYTGIFCRMLIYQFASKKMQLRLQDRYLKKLLKYAKKNSEYYSKEIPDDLDFSKIKPIDKLQFIENFDKIVTDKNVTLERVKNEIKNTSKEKGATLDGKYTITMTSGSTGNPTIIINDKHYRDSTSLISSFRIYKFRYPLIMVTEAGGFGIESSMIGENMKKMKNLKNFIHMIDIEKESTDNIIVKLKKYKNSTIVGYTGVMTIIANKLIDKNIKIKAKQIYLSGEKCGEFEKAVIAKAFDCKNIRTIYGCTEGGSIAYECKCGHLHIMSDTVKIEPVDKDNNPVGYDELSDKVLLTNLTNKVQPIIRYEVTDRIILHKGGACKCGSKEDWLEIEGRTNDNIQIEQDGKIVSIPSISLLIAMAGINKNGLEKFKNYQVAVYQSGHLLITLDYSADADKDAVNKEIEEKITEFFKIHGVNNVTYEFKQGTLTKTQRGKYKRVYMVKDA